MLTDQELKFIEENIHRLSLKSIAKKLGIRPKQLRKEIHKLKLKPRSKPSQPATFIHKYGSINLKNRKIIIILAMLILAATFLVYFNCLKNGFIWDDKYLIVNNSQIKSFSHLSNVFKTCVGYGSDNPNNFYRPMQELSNMTDYFFWKKNPMGFHLTNVLLHSFAAILVYLFIFYLSGNITIAALCGLLFGIHPINTEAVTYIAGRADMLYSIFFLSSLILFIRYVNHMVEQVKANTLLILSLVCFIFSLLSKEASIVLPLIIFAYIYIILKNSLAEDTYRNIRNLWIPYAIIVAVYFLLRSTVFDFSSFMPPSMFDVISKFSFPIRLFTFFKAVVNYYLLLMFPIGLHMERIIDVTKQIFEPNAILAFLIVSATIASGFILYRKNRLISFFIFWFFINLLPVSNIYPINSFIAEHWLYMAALGYFFILAFLLHNTYIKNTSKMLKLLIVLLTTTLLITYSFLTIKRNMDWRNEITFFKNTLKYSPKNARLHLALGNAYYEKKKVEDAIKQYKKVISIKKDYAMGYSNIGAAYMTQKKFVEAEKYLKKAAQLRFNFPFVHYALGIIYYNTNRANEAIPELELSIKQMPNYYMSLNFLGKIYGEHGDRKRAVETFQKSLQIMPEQKEIKDAIKQLSPKS